MKKLFLFLTGAAIAVWLLPAYGKTERKVTASGLDTSAFEISTEQGQTHLFRLTNKHGSELCVSDLGARIVSLIVPDSEGGMREVVLGFDSLQTYFPAFSEFGATIGRYANRIGYGRLVIESDTLMLSRNSGEHTLHGGRDGWQHRLFAGRQHDHSSVELKLFSPDGDMGFPGNVNLSVLYTLTDENEVKIEYRATTDRKTVINLTNHSYFNLSGSAANDVLQHELYIDADHYTPVDRTVLPTGEISSVADTRYDFNAPKKLTVLMDGNSRFRGLDNNWVLNAGGDVGRVAASLYSPESGIIMEVYTTEPGMQVYTPFMWQPPVGRGGVRFCNRPAICLETQHFPDSPSHSDWPSVMLEPGDTFCSQTIYRFGVVKK